MRYTITPVPKPRMTRRDKWAKRKCVQRYWDFKDECRQEIKEPLNGKHITFYLPMPKSWSKAKKERMAGTPHMQTPDKDNLDKALADALYKDDSVIWDTRSTKLWAYTGSIVIKPMGWGVVA